MKILKSVMSFFTTSRKYKKSRRTKTKIRNNKTKKRIKMRGG